MMIIEPLDVVALRLAEARSYFLAQHTQDFAALLDNAGMTGEDYIKRLHRLRQAGLIRSFHLTIIVPRLLGGKWVWAAMLAKTQNPLENAKILTSRLPFVTEILINSCLPQDVGPNLGLLFYSRDFDNEIRFIQASSGLQDVEVFKIQEYSYPVALPLSRDEQGFLRFLANNPQADIGAIVSAFGQNENWVRAKLDRLLWNEKNPSGVFRIQADIDWSVVNNFGHFHFLLETGHRPEQIVKLLGDEGFQLILAGRPVSGRFVGVEADVWGLSDLLRRVEFLEKINGIRVAGVIYHREVLIHSVWVLKIIGA